MNLFKQPNILFIIPNLTTGGIQTHVVLLAKHFKENLNCNVTIWGIHTQDAYFTQMLTEAGLSNSLHPEIFDFFTTSYWQLTKWQKLTKWYKLKKAIDDNNFDVIMPYTLRISFVVNIIWGFTKAKACFMFERGGHGKPKPIQHAKHDIYHFLARHPKSIYVANSEHGQIALSIMQKTNKKNVHVIRNAYLPKQVMNIDEPWKNFIKSNSSKIVVTMLANFFDEKDHATVIKAWHKIPRNSAILIFAGLGGPQSCKENQQIAIELTQSLGLETEIFFAGSVKDTTALLQASNIGLLSTISEGCPNAILEYMGSKLPIIATQIPGIIEIISEKNQEYLFPVGDDKILGKHLSDLIQNKDMRTELGEFNYNHVITNFAPEIMFEKYEAILREKGILN